VAIDEELPGARKLALLDLEEFGEQPIADPGALGFSEEQVLGV
jgi:hypothetical protein